MDLSYWKKQTAEKPLFPEVLWNKPEQKSRAGKLGIIGGNKNSFMAVADSYTAALNAGVGEVKLLLPDCLKKSLPTVSEATFATSNPSGGFSKDAWPEIKALYDWADGILLAGDAGGNSETAVLFERLIQTYAGQLTVSRDVVDLLKNSYKDILDRENTLLVVSFSQLQNIFRKVYYPKMITFNIQLTQLVETLHKFTITYPVTIVVHHEEHIIIASGGDVVTQAWQTPMQIWRGITSTHAACYWLWHKNKPLEAVVTSLAQA